MMADPTVARLGVCRSSTYEIEILRRHPGEPRRPDRTGAERRDIVGRLVARLQKIVRQPVGEIAASPAPRPIR
jgi:hypothetical protein